MITKHSMTPDAPPLACKQMDEEQKTGRERYRPVIGFPVPIQQGSQGPQLSADAIGAWAVERSQGRLLLIPLWPFPTHKHIYQSLWPLIQLLDGLLLPAGLQGVNWYDAWSAQEPGPQNWPVRWEIALAQLATSIGMPVLGVADGAEKWHAALGGSFHMQEERPQNGPTSPDQWEQYDIHIRPQSKLALSIHAVDKQPWMLPFMPLPYLRIQKRASGLQICARSSVKGIVAFERSDPAFGLGILARPDWSLDEGYSLAVFEAFIHASCSFARTRQQDSTGEASRDAICAALSERMAQRLPLLSIPSSERKEAQAGQGRDTRDPAQRTPRSERVHTRAPTRSELNAIRRKWLNVSTK